MRIKIIHIIFLFLFFVITAFEIIDHIKFPVPRGWPKPVYDFKSNPYSKEKIELGRSLFYDPLLSVNNSTSCASCHSPYNAFAHTDHQLSHGVFDSIGTRNAPALMNLAWNSDFMWDGSIDNLNDQALTPLSHPSEMGEKIEHVLSKLNNKKYYRMLCANAYGDSLVTKERFLKSLAQFEVSLISAESKYDSVLRHQAYFTEQESKGYRIFKANCAACHNEPLFTNNNFKNNGLAINPALNDFGRMKITHQSKDSMFFKVPSLRNVEYSFPYMHDGRFTKLSEVIKHYTSPMSNNLSISKELKKGIELSSSERVDLITFLLTLSDKKFLFNPQHSFPKQLINPE
ncbi:MAG: cytochrome c peroxidase [Bacteroidota bacterium]